MVKKSTAKPKAAKAKPKVAKAKPKVAKAKSSVKAKPKSSVKPKSGVKAKPKIAKAKPKSGVRPKSNVKPKSSVKPKPLSSVGYVIYGKEHCPFAIRAQLLLQKHKLPFKFHVITNTAATHKMLSPRVPASFKTSPMIFYNGAFIGGSDELSLMLM